MIRHSRINPDHPGKFRCPQCAEFKPPTCFYINKRNKIGIGQYCKDCSRARKRKHHLFRADAFDVVCSLCKQTKKSPLFWRYLKPRGEPICYDCKVEYCRVNKTTTIPKYLVCDGKRTCAKCLLAKPLSAYNKSATAKLGISTHCTECCDAMTLAHRVKANLPTHSKGNIDRSKEKMCGRCGHVRPLSFFYPDKAKTGGLTASCKLCVKFYNANWYQKNGAKYARRWIRELARSKPLSLRYWRYRVRPQLYAEITPAQARDLFVSKQKCEYCSMTLSAWECELDHKLPISRGGGSAISNIAISCSPCNSAKGSMTDTEYREWLEALRVRLNQVARSDAIIRKRIGTWNVSEIISRIA